MLIWNGTTNEDSYTLTTVCPYCEGETHCPYGHPARVRDYASPDDLTTANASPVAFPLYVAAWLAILAFIFGYRLLGGQL